MSDRVIINVRERPLSSDLMLMQRIQQRSTADLFRYAFGSQFGSEGFGGVANQNYSSSFALGLCCAGTIGSTNVTVLDGILLLNHATVPTAINAADSTYRVGQQRAALAVTLPVVGGSGRWCILLATVQEVVAISETRDIMNPTTAHFEPVVVAKLREWRVALSWLQGANGLVNMPVPINAMADPGPYVPLCAVFVTSGGTVGAAIVDLRPTLESRRPNARRQNWGNRPLSKVITHSTADLASNSCSVTVTQAISSQDTPGDRGGGLNMRYLGSGVSLNSPVQDLSPGSGSQAWLEPGIAFAANQFYFWYMAPWDDYAPSSGLGNTDNAGILVLSAQPPGPEGYNLLPLNLPVPFGLSSCPTGRAPCVGIVWRNPLNSGFVPMEGQNGVYRFSDDNQQSARIASADPVAVANLKSMQIPPMRLPLNARSVKLRLDCIYGSLTAATSLVSVNIKTIGAANIHTRTMTALPATTGNGSGFSVFLDTKVEPALGLHIDVLVPPDFGSAAFTIMNVHLIELRT